MYTPRAFAEDDLAGLDALLARDAFITLVTTGPDGQPFASHLPVLYSRQGAHIQLRGHWARPNPQSGHGPGALAIVHGPHHYISAEWYPDKAQASRVPTWNYAVAHLQGRLQVSNEPALLATIVAGLARQHEPQVGAGWEFSPDDLRQMAQLGGITGFTLDVERVELKFKLNQNHPADNVVAVADALQALGRPAADEVAMLMRQRLRRPG
jgi:transcriptional regulator